MENPVGQSYLLEFKKENIRDLAHILKAMSFREYGVIYPFDNGLKLSTDDGLYQQANAYLDASIFTMYKCREQKMKLRLNIKDLAELLSITDDATSSVRGTYCGFGEPLELILEEQEEFVIRARLTTSLPESILDFDFNDANVVATCMMKTTVLRDIFKDFDATSRTLTISVTNNELEFTTNGEIGCVTTSIPSKSLEVETMKCDISISTCYQLYLIQRMNVIISYATKVIIRIDERGVLCAQFTIEEVDAKQRYIEFLTAPSNDDENLDKFHDENSDED